MDNIQDKGNLFNLVSKLKLLMEIKYPERKWSNEFFYHTLLSWTNHETELINKINQLESQLLK